MNSSFNMIYKITISVIPKHAVFARILSFNFTDISINPKIQHNEVKNSKYM